MILSSDGLELIMFKWDEGKRTRHTEPIGNDETRWECLLKEQLVYLLIFIQSQSLFEAGKT